MILNAGVRFTIASRTEPTLAPACIIWQRRDPASYFVQLPRHGAGPSVGFAKVTLSGHGVIETPAGRREVPRGACLVTSFDDHISYRAGPGGWDFVFMTLIGRGARCLVDDLMAAHGHVVAVDPDGPTVRGLIDQARGSSIRTAQLDAGAAARLAGNLLIHLMECNAERVDSEEQLIFRATGLLGANLADPPSVSNVARACDVSREHLTRVFHARMGLPPGQWVRNERLRHADLLLRSTGLPVAEIARQVGFQSASAFIAAFRASYGASPGKLRREG